MTPREMEVLQILHRLGGQCTIGAVSKKIGLSANYCYVLFKTLTKQALTREIANNVFMLTFRGQSLLEELKTSKGKSAADFPAIAVRVGSGSLEHSSSRGAEKDFAKELSARWSPSLDHNLSRFSHIEITDDRAIKKSVKLLSPLFLREKKSHATGQTSEKQKRLTAIKKRVYVKQEGKSGVLKASHRPAKKFRERRQKP